MSEVYLSSARRIEFALDSDLPLFDAVAALTLFLAVIFGFEDAAFKITSQIALVVVLLRADMLRCPWLWIVLALVGTLVLNNTWDVADNHKFLLLYWLWVVAIASCYDAEADKRRLLSINARFFLIFIFLAAVMHKVFSSSYMSGEMFETRLLLDDRFKAFAHLFGIDKSVTDAALLNYTRLQSPFTEFENNELLLPASDRSRLLALIITWYDLLVQIFIGILFISGRKVTDFLAHAVLLFFIVTTYLPAPVFGFGWTLAVLGFTLARGSFPRLAAAYLAAGVAVLAYQTPWREWVLAL